MNWWIWVFWYPQIIQFNRVFHYKPSILGYLYFWKHPYEHKHWKTIKHNIIFIYVSWNLVWSLVGWLNQNKDQYGFQVCVCTYQKGDAPQLVSYYKSLISCIHKTIQNSSSKMFVSSGNFSSDFRNAAACFWTKRFPVASSPEKGTGTRIWLKETVQMYTNVTFV